MDSTPNPTPLHPHPLPQFLPVKASATKLPIKRKTPDASSSNPNPNPNSSPSPFPTGPKLEFTATDDPSNYATADDDDVTTGGDCRPPPFKFHRIWTESDEIRFLQGLLDCSSEGLSFPRDLNGFYTRFSDTMSQPYSKSQLSEKLRRLRKKFRVISSRLSKGIDKALLSPHDRSLFELSKELWHPENSSTSPFGSSNNNKPKKSNLVGVKVSFSPTLPSVSVANRNMINELTEPSELNCVDNDSKNHDDEGGFEVDGDVKLSEVNVEFEDIVGEEELPVQSVTGSGGGGIGQVAAKNVIDVFDQSLKEVRLKLNLVRQGLLHPDHGSITSSNDGKVEGFEKRWQEQRVAELEVLARRLR